MLAEYSLLGSRAARYFVSVSPVQDNTSVVLANNGGFVGLSMSRIAKEGYGGPVELVNAWGNNAAINLVCESSVARSHTGPS